MLASRPRCIFLLTVVGVPTVSQQLLWVCHHCWRSQSSSGMERSCSCPVLQASSWSEHEGSLCQILAVNAFLTQLCQCCTKAWAFPVSEMDPRCRVCSQLLCHDCGVWNIPCCPNYGAHPGYARGFWQTCVSRDPAPLHLAVISTMAMVSFSFLVGIIRVQLCWCALWSLPLCHGTSGGRACGMPTSLPLSSGIPFPSTLPGWSTALLTCMATGLMTSTSTPGRIPLSLWEPLVSAVALDRALQTVWHTILFYLDLGLGHLQLDSAWIQGLEEVEACTSWRKALLLYWWCPRWNNTV